MITLGELIEQLEAVPDKTLIVKYENGEVPTDIGSWRGDYSQLALSHEPEGETTVAALIDILEYAVGKSYGGYKGGEYKMGLSTTVWRDNYGAYTDTEIMGIETRGDQVIILTQENL